MALPNIFSKEVADQVIGRINQLTPETKAVWGKMNVAQMLAHCSVSYEMVFEPEKHPKPNAFLRFILKKLVKPKVVGEGTYGQGGKTAPQFIIADAREFEAEKNRLINYITKTQELGEDHFEGKESNSFGVMNKTEWNNMFYKHLDHHLKQFGVS